MKALANHKDAINQLTLRKPGFLVKGGGGNSGRVNSEIILPWDSSNIRCVYYLKMYLDSQLPYIIHCNELLGGPGYSPGKILKFRVGAIFTILGAILSRFGYFES